MANIRALDPLPPGAGSEIHTAPRFAEHHGTGIEHLRESSWVIFGSRQNFSVGTVTRGGQKAYKLRIGHGRTVVPETVVCHPVSGRLLGIVLVRIHEERACRDPDHSGRG